MNRISAFSCDSLSDRFDAMNGDHNSPDEQIMRGLLSASKKPTRPDEIRSFRKLHGPRIHKMAEWLLQYECVCRREQQYLQQIKELRAQFQSHDKDRLASDRDASKAAFIWRPSPAPFPKLNEKFANSVCVLRPQRKHAAGLSLPLSDVPKRETTEFVMAARSMNPSNYPAKKAKQSYKLPQIVRLDRNKTDYEPFEHIVERNQINFNKYF